jgi:hypothetical protein
MMLTPWRAISLVDTIIKHKTQKNKRISSNHKTNLRKLNKLTQIFLKSTKETQIDLHFLKIFSNQKVKFMFLLKRRKSGLLFLKRYPSLLNIKSPPTCGG